VKQIRNGSSGRSGDPAAPRGGLAPIDEILKRWMKQNHVARRVSDKAIFVRWKEIVGDEIASHTRVVDLDHGELIIEVDSSPLLNELSTYYRSEILESLRQAEGIQKVHKLRFRAGSF
jgi:predicted nucleic acid-binding Zn ribbon protein